MFDKYHQFLNWYLMNETQFIIVETNECGQITNYNTGFEEIYGHVNPEDNLLEHYLSVQMLAPDQVSSSDIIEGDCIHERDVICHVKGRVFSTEDSHFYLLEKTHTEDMNLVEKLCAINMALSNDARAVHKRNRELKNKNKTYAHIMLTDPLTGLNNRRFLYDQYKILTEQMTVGNIQNLSLVMLDIDKFKEVNDKYGHDVGDLVLKALADIIKSVTREGDLTIRYGGDEFLIMFINMPTSIMKKRLLKMETLIDQCQIDNYYSGFSVSYGIAEYIKNESLETFIKRADIQLYKAKNH